MESSCTKPDDVVKSVLSEAKVIMETKPTPLSPQQVELAKYFIDDVFKDIQDVISHRESLGLLLIRAKFVERCNNIFYDVHQLRRDKDKRVKIQLLKHNQAFTETVELAIKEDMFQLEHISKLREMTESFLGGRRPVEWQLKSDLKL